MLYRFHTDTYPKYLIDFYGITFVYFSYKKL